LISVVVLTVSSSEVSWLFELFSRDRGWLFWGLFKDECSIVASENRWRKGSSIFDGIALAVDSSTLAPGALAISIT